MVALTIAIGSLVGMELWVRARGHRPSVADEPSLWAMARADVDNDRDVVAFVGTSRMGLGYSPQAFASIAPDLRGVQLAIHKSSPIAVLEDLADDDKFIGIAIIDVTEWDLERSAWRKRESWVEQEHRLWRTPGAIANRYLAGLAQHHVALLQIGGRRLLASLIGHLELPRPNWVITDRDRSQRGDYSLATAKELERHVAEMKPVWNPTAPAVWLAALGPVTAAVARIQARGGRVAFIRMPVTGAFGRDADARYPRGEYWDAFANAVHAPALHFRDIPAMATMVCPDDMHLDQRDQRAFTTSLIGTLRSRGLFDAIAATRP